ncbi:MAG: serine/threonine protein kinase [Planctomycetes bacterium]|nr:serine/threonine protein kinase [Planctomycetota bacterium]
MTPPCFQRISELVLAALERKSEQREAFLESECGDDNVLLNEVRSLLAANDEHDALDLTGGMDQLAGGRDDKKSTGPRLPKRIGQYEIIDLIGEGGMGVVFRARQDDPKRDVAVKLIRPGFVSRAMAARFRHEAQVLGQLNHPGIAQVYEAGTSQPDPDTPGGGPQPFIAMEYVAGRPISEYARQEALPLPGRLALLLSVCRGVEHAHQKGVIHRDLKPANILVTDAGQPKILDFGIARATDADIQMTTLPTDSGQLVGTLPYMSPEQVAGDSHAIDTRSDVYALGVVGYELLAGRLPIPIAGMPITEAILAIRDREPPLLGSLVPSLRGDLQIIFQQALEKDPARRYQSVGDFAGDIRRYLDDRPIVARPASTLYHIRKFARRNKALVGGAIATILALALGLVGTTFAMVRATTARDAADASAARAQMEAAKSAAVNTFLQEMLGSVSPALARGKEITVREVLDRAAKKMDDGTLKDEPEVQGAVRMTIGNTYGALGAYAEAEKHLRAGLAIQRRASGAATSELPRALDALASLFLATGDYAGAKSLFFEALAIRRTLLEAEHSEIADSLHNLALSDHHMGELAEAERRYREALIMRRNVFGAEHTSVAESMFDLASLLNHKGDLDGAESLYRQALSMNRKLLGDDHPEVSHVLTGLAAVLSAKGKFIEAEALYREALANSQQVYGDEHPALVLLLNNLAHMLKRKGDFARAEPIQREALAMGRKLLGAEHPTVITSFHNLASLLLAQGDAESAEPMFLEALEMRRRVHGAEHPRIADSLSALARLANIKGDHEEAERLYRDALSIRRKKLPSGHWKTAVTTSLLGETLGKTGRREEAETLLLGGYAGLKDNPHAPDSYRREALQRIVELYDAWGKLGKAAEHRAKLESSTNPDKGESEMVTEK